MIRCLTIILLYFFISPVWAQNSLISGKGEVHFTSDAPLEIIKASSKDLSGVIDTSKGEFAFTMLVASFLGFNSPLQAIHFNEHYLETKKHPSASYLGKIIEDVSWSTLGEYHIRTKGKLQIHGKVIEMVIPVTLHITANNLVEVEGAFKINLDDFDIKIPKIVQANIAQEIQVLVNINFK